MEKTQNDSQLGQPYHFHGKDYSKKKEYDVNTLKKIVEDLHYNQTISEGSEKQ